MLTAFWIAAAVAIAATAMVIAQIRKAAKLPG